jgi:hypothetical protein
MPSPAICSVLIARNNGFNKGVEMKILFFAAVLLLGVYLIYAYHGQMIGNHTGSSSSSMGSSSDEQSDSAIQQQARDFFESEMGKWMAGSKSQATTPIKNSDGSMVWDPVMLNYEIKSFEKEGDGYVATCNIKIKSEAETEISHAITFRIFPDSSGTAKWKVMLGTWGDV